MSQTAKTTARHVDARTRGRRGLPALVATTTALTGVAILTLWAPPAVAFSASPKIARREAHGANHSDRPETAGGVLHTWTDYRHAAGKQGPSVASHETVEIACRVKGFKVADGNVWWYRVASSPWDGGYYVSADGFYNNGRKSGSLLHTPFFDEHVALC